MLRPSVLLRRFALAGMKLAPAGLALALAPAALAGQSLESLPSVGRSAPGLVWVEVQDRRLLERATLRTVLDRSAYSPGDTARLAVRLVIDPGWHTNSSTPSFENLIATQVEVHPPDGWGQWTVRYPPGSKKAFSFVPVPIDIYEGASTVLASAPVPADALPGGHNLDVLVTYQACDDRQCLAPVTVTVGADLVVAAEGVISEPVEPTLFAEAERAVEAAVGLSFSLGQADGAGGDLRTLVSFLALAFLGGLILNFMPCVLPVLSVKAFGLAKSAAGGNRRRLSVDALATVGGIVFCFLLLAGLAVVARQGGAAAGWGIQFQEPVFVGVLSVALLLFALNLWGLFEIRLPRAIGAASMAVAGGPDSDPTHRATLREAVGTGFLTTLMATPCSAPFLGTALGFALAQPAAVTMGMFTAMGLGMGAPYLAMAAAPGLALRVLPRPGAWMIGFRKVMGFFVLAALLWLLYVLDGLVGPALAAWFQGALLAAALFVWAAANGGRIWKRVAAGAAAISVAGGLWATTWNITPATPDALGVPPGERLIAWEPFNERRVAELLSEGRPVFVDVTADWCITCKVNERLFLETEEVAAAFVNNGVVAMKADWTRRSDAIARYLAGFGRYGIPFHVLYRPGRPPHVFPEFLSGGAIINALGD